jgi:hypothetical protein
LRARTARAASLNLATDEANRSLPSEPRSRHDVKLNLATDEANRSLCPQAMVVLRHLVKK